MKNHYDFSQGRRGAVNNVGRKIKTSIRFDPEVLNWFKNKIEESGGGNYQSLINQVLKEYITNQGEPLEHVLRRITRQEIQMLVEKNIELRPIIGDKILNIEYKTKIKSESPFYREEIKKSLEKKIKDTIEKNKIDVEKIININILDSNTLVGVEHADGQVIHHYSPEFRIELKDGSYYSSLENN